MDTPHIPLLLVLGYGKCEQLVRIKHRRIHGIDHVGGHRLLLYRPVPRRVPNGSQWAGWGDVSNPLSSLVSF